MYPFGSESLTASGTRSAPDPSSPIPDSGTGAPRRVSKVDRAIFQHAPEGAILDGCRLTHCISVVREMRQVDIENSDNLIGGASCAPTLSS